MPRDLPNHAPLTGIIPPLVTPLHEEGRLDLPSLERLIEHVLGGNVSALFILGTTGLTRGNLSTHAAKLVAAGYVEEKKQIVDRKLLTEYRLTDVGRKAFTRYRVQWIRLTSGTYKKATK